MTRAEALLAIVTIAAIAGCGKGVDPVAGTVADATIDTAEAAAVTCGTWRAGPRLNDPREQAAALLLRDGRVLVAGAHHIDPPGGRDIGSAEIFSSAAETWVWTTPLNSVRGATRGLTVMLRDGHVLTAQQETNDGTAKPIPAEVYDPVTAKWSVTPLMTHYANGPMAALPDGALVMGGVVWQTGETRGNAERYRVETGAWTETGRLQAPRVGHFALAMGDAVLVVGGADKETDGKILATAEVYDPKTELFRSVGPMAEARWYPACAVLKDGRVLAAGSGDKDMRTAEVYDPKTETWSPTGSMADPRAQGTLTLLHDGRVLAAGGGGEGGDQWSAEIYDPKTGVWTTAGDMPGARRLHTAVTLPNGEVLVVGGFHHYQLTTTAIYTPCKT